MSLLAENSCRNLPHMCFLRYFDTEYLYILGKLGHIAASLRQGPKPLINSAVSAASRKAGSIRRLKSCFRQGALVAILIQRPKFVEKSMNKILKVSAVDKV